MASVVHLRRHDTGTSWGFRLSGGVDFQQPLHVGKISAGSPAFKAGLRPGDAVLQICNTPTQGMTHNQAKAEILRCGNELDFVINRPSEAYAAFFAYDTDGNGFVTRDEAHRVLEQQLGFTPAQTVALMNESDFNSDGKLSYYEFVDFYDRVRARKGGVDQSFRQFDKQGKGFITFTDCKNILGSLGFTDRDIIRVFNAHDTNRDGVLQYSEFMSFWNAPNLGAAGSASLTVLTTPAPAPVFAPAPLFAPAPAPVFASAPAPAGLTLPGETFAAFQAYDADGNGFITRDEAHRVLSTVLGFSPSQSIQMLGQCDYNNDGKLNYREFATFYDKVKSRKNAIDGAFKQFDGGKGYITFHDAQRILGGMGFTERDIIRIFHNHDENRDGVLQYSEFMNFWNAAPGGAGSVPPSGRATMQVISSSPAIVPAMAAPTSTLAPTTVVVEYQPGEAFAAFQQYDRDGNGFITRDEAHSVLNTILGFTPEQTISMLSQCDYNHDGKLSYHEFAGFYDKVKSRKAAIDQAFRQYDKAGKGYITFQDAKQILGGMGFSERDVLRIFHNHDTNRDGLLQYDEFQQFWNAPPPGVATASARQRPVQRPVTVTIPTNVSSSNGPAPGGSLKMPGETFAAFQQYDRNGDGHVTRHEATIVLRQLLGFNDQQTNSLLSSCDYNNDGRLSYREFVDFYDKVKTRKGAVDQSFQQFSGGKGYITMADARRVLGALAFTESDIQRIFRIHDSNRDGVLQYNEFMTFWNV